jgi:hypothetical protein
MPQSIATARGRNDHGEQLTGLIQVKALRSAGGDCVSKMGSGGDG